jgi:hypothetical protein
MVPARTQFMRRLSLALIAALILGSACSVQPPPLPRSPSEAPVPFRVHPPDITDESFPSPLPLASAEKILRETTVFDMAFPGYRPGRQVQAFNVVLDQRDSRDRFHRLSREGRAPGRLYALCGLLLLARGEGDGFAHSLSLVAGDVTVREADYIFETSIVRAVVLVYADDVANKLRAQRDAAYSLFAAPR